MPLPHTHEVTVRYDEQTGVPTSTLVDHMQNAIDDEITYTVTHLTPVA